MRRLKVMTILGTRPEIIRLSACLQAFDRYFDHVLVHTGQNWDRSLNQIFFEDLGLRMPDHQLSCVGEGLGDTMGNIISASYQILKQEKPDALLVLGDTNSALSVISAKRLKIPIFHMEAGNRCFDINVPEEINRRIVDHVADINLAYTEHARRYLLAEGIQGDRIFVTGSPLAEVFSLYAQSIESSPVLKDMKLIPGKYLVVSAHREENIDRPESFLSLMNAVNAAAEEYGYPIIFSVHPRSRKEIRRRDFIFHPLVRQMAPLGLFAYCKLQKEAFCVLSDSGTLSEESAMLGFPAVLVRTSTERPEALEKGNVVLAGIETEGVLQAIEVATAIHRRGDMTASVTDYEDTDVSAKVVRIIQSYAGLISKSVWNK